MKKLWLLCALATKQSWIEITSTNEKSTKVKYLSLIWFIFSGRDKEKMAREIDIWNQRQGENIIMDKKPSALNVY